MGWLWVLQFGDGRDCDWAKGGHGKGNTGLIWGYEVCGEGTTGSRAEMKGWN
jgi:hypothetical protein